MFFLDLSVAFEDIVEPREDSDDKLKLLFKIPGKEREFRIEEDKSETSESAEIIAESQDSGKYIEVKGILNRHTH